jgi:hypothetical protein
LLVAQRLALVWGLLVARWLAQREVALALFLRVLRALLLVVRRVVPLLVGFC